MFFQGDFSLVRAQDASALEIIGELERMAALSLEGEVAVASGTRVAVIDGQPIELLGRSCQRHSLGSHFRLVHRRGRVQNDQTGSTEDDVQIGAATVIETGDIEIEGESQRLAHSTSYAEITRYRETVDPHFAVDPLDRLPVVDEGRLGEGAGEDFQVSDHFLGANRAVLDIDLVGQQV